MIAIVVAVAVTAAVMDLVVAPALQGPSATQPAFYHVTTFDVGYDQPGFNPQLTAKAGQRILIEMNNSGAMAHEFLLFSGDRTTILNSAKAALALAQRHNPGWDTNSDIANATLDEYTMWHDTWNNLSRVGCPDSCVDHDVDPGATSLFWFVINTPGTYFFACHQVDTTSIPWKIHQDKGMWGTLVVS
ncbi:MAG TPA: hypothetical protein VFA17_02330 [Thermoplasmata archaeon]|nr:hypothetical protein [Thermoplasmata archaeon]